METKVGIMVQKPKLELLHATVIYRGLKIEYGFLGDEDSYLETEVDDYELADLLGMTCPGALHESREDEVMDFVREHTDEVARQWLRAEERRMLKEKVNQSVNLAKSRLITA